MRQFRLIFGASTYATAAVLAIFLGGLGIGSAILGRRVDAHPRPLRFYAHLELLIATASLLSPLLLWIVAKIYFGVGGSVTLGLFFATIVRLLLALLVLGIPTFLMGGTLPAAARAVESPGSVSAVVSSPQMVPLMNWVCCIRSSPESSGWLEPFWIAAGGTA